MKTIQGNLITLAEQGNFDVIIHGCNCFCTMGAGIAKTIKQKFPEAYEADLATEDGDESKLGSYTVAKVKANGHEVLVVNAYTQYNWRGPDVKANYEAIKSVFKKVKTEFSGLRIGYPAIGAGLAGGDWNVISKIIDDALEGENYTFVEFRK